MRRAGPRREGRQAALSSEMRVGESRGALEARTRGSTPPASGERWPVRSPLPQRGLPGEQQRRGGQGASGGSGEGGRVAGGCGAKLAGIGGGSSGLRRDTPAPAGAWGWSIRVPCAAAARAFTCPLFLRTGPANPAGRGAGRAAGCGRRSEEGRQGSRGRGCQPQGRPIATAPGPARGHQVAGSVGPPSARAPQRAQIQRSQQEGLVQGLLRPQAGPNRLHERPGMLVRRPLAAVSTADPAPSPSPARLCSSCARRLPAAPFIIPLYRQRKRRIK